MSAMTERDKKFPYAEFNKFRWAHANANRFLLVLSYIFLSLFLLFWWLRDREFLGVIAMLGVVVIIAFIPRLGFYLARHIVGFYYKEEFYGRSYNQYRAQEKLYDKEPEDPGSN